MASIQFSAPGDGRKHAEFIFSIQQCKRQSVRWLSKARSGQAMGPQRPRVIWYFSRQQDLWLHCVVPRKKARFLLEATGEAERRRAGHKCRRPPGYEAHQEGASLWSLTTFLLGRLAPRDPGRKIFNSSIVLCSAWGEKETLVAQSDKPVLATLASHIGARIQALAVLPSVQLPMNVPRKAIVDEPSTWLSVPR